MGHGGHNEDEVEVERGMGVVGEEERVVEAFRSLWAARTLNISMFTVLLAILVAVILILILTIWYSLNVGYPLMILSIGLFKCKDSALFFIFINYIFFK